MVETLKIPKEVVDSDWTDDVDAGYAIYGNTEKMEREYVSPNEVSKESINRIKKHKLGHTATLLFKSKDKLAA